MGAMDVDLESLIKAKGAKKEMVESYYSAVRDKIKGMVSDEDSTKPLTDQAIVQLLKADGVKIARRTVAKYRDQMGILPARMRKRV